MAGVPADIKIDAAWSTNSQQAALMMTANVQLSHFPPNTWTCWTEAGSQAAGNSNLALGTYGAESIDAFMEDYGDGNAAVGHRRWILYPYTRRMGTGGWVRQRACGAQSGAKPAAETTSAMPLQCRCHMGAPQWWPRPLYLLQATQWARTRLQVIFPAATPCERAPPN